MKITVTSCILYPFYDDNDRRVHYNDDDHALYDTWGFVVPPNVWLQPINPTMMGLGGVWTVWWAQARTCEPCVGKYYTSNLSRREGISMMVLNDRVLIISWMCLHSVMPNNGSLIEYFSKYSSHICNFYFFRLRQGTYVRLTTTLQVKTMTHAQNRCI